MLPLMALLFACGGAGPTPMLDGDGFFDSPWPSYDRVNALGGPELAGFPKSEDIELLGNYVALGADVLDGASPVAPIYFRFDGPIDAAQLPAEGTTSSGDSVFLINIDGGSPGWGERVPLRFDFQATETAYQPTNLLALAPLVGTPLRPNTRYAAVITTAIASPHPAMEERFDADHPDYAEAWQPLRLALFEQGIPIEDVAGATVFTTSNPTEEMASIAWRIRETLGHQSLNQELDLVTQNQFFTLYEGRVFLPVWQAGERPYASEGGGFVLDAEGAHAIDHWERVAFSFAVPRNVEMPNAGWPIVIYAHGTGGDHTSCCSTAYSTSPAASLTKAGLAVIGVAQPLHGDRATPGTNVELHTFNFLNPTSGRSTFRQGALDSVYLAHILAETNPVFTVEGEEVRLDPRNVLYMGHSQGGITGALALPYVGDHVKAAVLSGAGGGLSLTLVYREQGGLDIEALMKELLDFDDDEDLDPLHPTVALIQTLTDVTDPLNFSSQWFSRKSPLALPPVSVLMTEGLQDVHTPPMTTEALAASAGLPVLEPAAYISLDHVAQGLAEPAPLPASGNLVGWDGSAVTGGLRQYADADHFAVFDLDEAAVFYASFLASSVDGEPMLDER